MILEDGLIIDGVKDSKKVSETKRRDLIHDIDRRCTFWMLAQSNVQPIDKYGIARCTMACMKWLAKICLHEFPEATVIVDGNKLIDGIPRRKQKAIIKADNTVQAVSAASIMAKVHRDTYMIEASQKWPEYEFQRHKGYPTKVHLQALQDHGVCPEHRRSYRPVQQVMK